MSGTTIVNGIILPKFDTMAIYVFEFIVLLKHFQSRCGALKGTLWGERVK